MISDDECQPKHLSRTDAVQLALRNHYVLQKYEEKDPVRRKRIEQHKKDAAPVIEDLKKANFKIYDSMSDIKNYVDNHKGYKKAIPILISWLPKIENIDVKQEIMACLRNRHAKSLEIVPFLFKEFYQADKYPGDYKWSVGDAIFLSVSESFFEEVVKIVKDKGHGIARMMLVLSLGKMKNSRAVDILIELLNDEEVRWPAIQALSKLRAEKARPLIEAYVNDPNSEVRKEAKKFIAKFNNT